MKQRILIEGEKPIIAVTVLFSEAEYWKLREQRYLTYEGTVRNVVRGLLKMQPLPIGFRLLGKGYTIVTVGQYESALSADETQ